MKATAGYSKTPLGKKLGYKSGFRVYLVSPPDYYMALFEDLPEDLEFTHDTKSKKDLIHIFSMEGAVLANALPHLRKQLKENGMLWISWPKKASGIHTDIDEYAVRKLGLDNGLVDIKKCAVDETWSGLKFVIPVRYRTQ